MFCSRQTPHDVWSFSDFFSGFFRLELFEADFSFATFATAAAAPMLAEAAAATSTAAAAAAAAPFEASSW